MKTQYNYTLQLDWLGNENGRHHRDDRLYNIQIEGKNAFKGSADKPFFGNPELYNPEDLLISSLSACHMMSYLYLCRKEGIRIISYQDNPNGILKIDENDAGRFESVELNPKIQLVTPEAKQRALELHKEASQLCFIANSVNFPITYKVIFVA